MVADTKHFDLPFQFDAITSHAREVEQDTLDDVVNCVYVAYLVEPPYRMEVPTFGVPSQVFDLQPLNLQEMIDAVYIWEGRAGIIMSQVIDPTDQTTLVDRLTSLVGLRSNVNA
ncbi:MAG TPA: hypothetical protein VGE97_10765 [Nitrososphaera sp.]|jgi:hypothetical protein